MGEIEDPSDGLLGAVADALMAGVLIEDDVIVIGAGAGGGVAARVGYQRWWTCGAIRSS